MERFKLGAFITNLGKFNEGEIIGEWINFPIKQEEFQEVLKRIGIDENHEEWFFSDFDTNLRGISAILSEYQNVDELNYLVALANELDSYDYEKFYGIVEDDMDLPENGIPGLINLTFNLEKYELYSNIFDEEEYGRYIIQDSGEYDSYRINEILDYIDYEAFGRDRCINENGSFTERGYVLDNQQNWQEEYDGTLENIPEEYRLTRPTESMIDAERDAVQRSKLKVLVVEPDKEPYVKEIEPGYRSLQNEIGGTIQGVYPFTDPVSILCNDNGKWMGLPLNRALRDEEGKIYDIVAGTFLVVGLTEDDYCSLDVEMLEKYSHMFKNPEMYVQVAGEIKALPVPDRTITFDMMKEYGHDSVGIAPLREKMAHKLLDAQFPVYNLIPSGTMERTASHQDIMEHAEKGGIFAIEKGAWMLFVETNPLAKVEELLEDDYGMIDGIINNGDKAKEAMKDKKVSVMETLQEKKMESSMLEKAAPKQQKSKEIELE